MLFPLKLWQDFFLNLLLHLQKQVAGKILTDPQFFLISFQRSLKFLLIFVTILVTIIAIDYSIRKMLIKEIIYVMIGLHLIQVESMI